MIQIKVSDYNPLHFVTSKQAHLECSLLMGKRMHCLVIPSPPLLVKLFCSLSHKATVMRVVCLSIDFYSPDSMSLYWNGLVSYRKSTTEWNGFCLLAIFVCGCLPLQILAGNSEFSNSKNTRRRRGKEVTNFSRFKFWWEILRIFEFKKHVSREDVERGD